MILFAPVDLHNGFIYIFENMYLSKPSVLCNYSSRFGIHKIYRPGGQYEAKSALPIPQTPFPNFPDIISRHYGSPKSHDWSLYLWFSSSSSHFQQNVSSSVRLASQARALQDSSLDSTTQARSVFERKVFVPLGCQRVWCVCYQRVKCHCVWRWSEHQKFWCASLVTVCQWSQYKCDNRLVVVSVGMLLQVSGRLRCLCKYGLCKTEVLEYVSGLSVSDTIMLPQSTGILHQQLMAQQPF